MFGIFKHDKEIEKNYIAAWFNVFTFPYI